MKHIFKDPSAVIHLPGNEQVTASNLTEEKYEQLIALSPGHADQFELASEEPKQKSEANKKG